MGLQTLTEFLALFDAHKNFAYTKINHGFWEGLSDAYAALGRPVAKERYAEADLFAARPYFFEGGFVDEFLALLHAAGEAQDPQLHIGLELSAWPGDNEILGTPHNPERSVPLLEEYKRLLGDDTDGLLLKRAAMDGSLLQFFERLRSMRVIVVGPEAVAPLGERAGFEEGMHLLIDARHARRTRCETEMALRAELDKPSSRETCVLLQAGTLAPYWLLRLRADYPDVRFVDGGLAFSIACPSDLMSRPWGIVYRRELLSTYAALPGAPPLPAGAERDLIFDIERDRRAQLNTSLLMDGSGQDVDLPDKVAFVEDKPLDITRMHAFMQPARRRNQWSNYGPAWEILARGYHRYMHQPETRMVVPCANGGMALEALAALHACKLGRPLRWVVSAFGFANTARGVFAEAQVLDANARGILSPDQLQALDPDSYDGFVVTNPFGLLGRFDTLSQFAAQSGKVMLIDNASGIAEEIPDHDYQSFSLHHTKPFGFGEGGLLTVPAEEVELVLALLGYTPLQQDFAQHWVGNGKISEVSCAALLQRLEAAPEWVPLYEMQGVRIRSIAERAGLRPLLPEVMRTVATSLPFIAPRPLPVPELQNPHFVIGKYYKPLADLPMARTIYNHLLNVPSHPDMKRVSSENILSVLRRCNQVRHAA